jgi:hypothetical protein
VRSDRILRSAEPQGLCGWDGSDLANVKMPCPADSAGDSPNREIRQTHPLVISVRTNVGNNPLRTIEPDYLISLS